MSGRTWYWIGTILIIIGAVLVWSRFLGAAGWIPDVGIFVLLAGALVIFFTRRTRR